MSKRNILAGLALSAAFLAAPAFADGKDGASYKRGPVPLQALDYNTTRNICPNGTIEYDNQGRLVCRTRSTSTHTTRPYAGTTTNRSYTGRTTTSRGYTSQPSSNFCSNGTIETDNQGRRVCRVTRAATTAPRRSYTPAPTRTYAPAPSRSYTPAPAPARSYTPAPTRISAPAPSAPSFNLASFTGGVGAGLGGGYFGGGGGFIQTSRAPFSGVLSSPAAALTFNRRVSRPTPQPHPQPHPTPQPDGGHGGGGHGCGC